MYVRRQKESRAHQTPFWYFLRTICRNKLDIWIPLGKISNLKKKSSETESAKWIYDHFKINKISTFFRKLKVDIFLQRAQTCTVVRSSWSEGHGCLATIFCSFSFYFFMHCNLRGGFVPMRFSLFPRIVQCLFCIWVPNMAS